MRTDEGRPPDSSATQAVWSWAAPLTGLAAAALSILVATQSFGAAVVAGSAIAVVGGVSWGLSKRVEPRASDIPSTVDLNNEAEEHETKIAPEALGSHHSRSLYQLLRILLNLVFDAVFLLVAFLSTVGLKHLSKAVKLSGFDHAVSSVMEVVVEIAIGSLVIAFVARDLTAASRQLVRGRHSRDR